jgi:hypothetical protein
MICRPADDQIGAAQVRHPRLSLSRSRQPPQDRLGAPFGSAAPRLDPAVTHQEIRTSEDEGQEQSATSASGVTREGHDSHAWRHRRLQAERPLRTVSTQLSSAIRHQVPDPFQRLAGGVGEVCAAAEAAGHCASEFRTLRCNGLHRLDE